MGVYEPREDSFLLEREVKKLARGKKVLDVGSGSGIQALAARGADAKEVVASDIEPESLKELRRKKLKVVKSDLFSSLKGKFDLIIFNPPYLPRDEREDSNSSRATTGGAKGDEIILKFLRGARKHLEKDGAILIVVSSLTPSDRINELLRVLKMQREIIARQKIFMEELQVWEILSHHI